MIDFIKTKYHLSARSLEIISVTDQDAGVYSCSVKYSYLGGKYQFENEKVHLNASARLDVLIKPTFKNQPENLIETDFGKTVEVKCVGISNPPANITWYKNAQMIDFSEENNIEITENDTKLVIQNVSKEDQAIYQCFLSNQAGSISAATLVKIISFAPKFTRDIENKTIYSDSNAVLSCGEVDGSPKPEITWSKINAYDFQPKVLQTTQMDGYQNGQFAFRPIPNSYFINKQDLIINSVTDKSEGWYKCVASNLLGSVSTKMYLQIKSKSC